MRLLLLVSALTQVVLSGHVAVRMPFLNPAGVTYTSYGNPAPQYNYDYSDHGYGYEAQAQLAYAAQVQHQQPLLANGPVAVGYAQVPVKTAVAVPTVHHVPAIADVPVTKYEAQPAVIQKIVDVAKPAIKTRKYEVRRPAIQKQFYDIEERTIVRPVGSALVELDEPLSKAQKGPAIVSSLDEHHHHQAAVFAEHGHAVAVTPVAHAVAVTPAAHTLAITPTAHTVAITPVGHHFHQESAFIDNRHFAPAVQHVAYSTTPAPIHFSTPAPLIVSTTPHYSEDSVLVEAAARNVAETEHAAYEAKLVHEEAVARAQINAKNAHLAVEAFSNGAALENHHALEQQHALENHQALANQQALENHHALANQHALESHQALANQHALESHHALENHNAFEAAKNVNHLSHEEAQENQQRLIKLLTARGGVAEVGFGRAGHSEHIGDAGISRARVLSATPSPHHAPVEEKVNTRRIVVSRPVQTLQEIDVVEPATKIEQVAINTPTFIKTARVGVQRVHTSVPVYGKALAPAVAHAQVPVGYYH
ncbi:uncharacterized protein LOC143916658 [Arctopsyche grandis]|uniref:uncharacterized protein LOC143916658 n=1 Tax=Arctopsyche grandis TaxID=121162 RepID=UPI00406D74E9